MSSKIIKIYIFFCYNSDPLLKDFYKIWHQRGTTRSASSRQISPLWL